MYTQDDSHCQCICASKVAWSIFYYDQFGRPKVGWEQVLSTWCDVGWHYRIRKASSEIQYINPCKAKKATAYSNDPLNIANNNMAIVRQRYQSYPVWPESIFLTLHLPLGDGKVLLDSFKQRREWVAEESSSGSSQSDETDIKRNLTLWLIHWTATLKGSYWRTGLSLNQFDSSVWLKV